MTNAAVGLCGNVTRAVTRAVVLFCLAVPFALALSASADAETRTLKLYYIHTGERAEITFKKDGKYVKSGLDKLNRFLRDWRRNEPTRMDPQLFDIVWEAYKMSGARDYIHVVSAYRSPATNEMLRRTRGGQAKKSQHMLGNAMDFFIPGVKLAKLREIGFKLQGGGVGYYPKSGSPFVHFDTGNVRAWPRMSRDELVRIFPKGGTLHLPPDGKPLPGYQQALAAYQSRKKTGQATAIAYAGGGDEGGRASSGKKNLLAGIFGGGADEEEDNVEEAAPVARATTVVTATPAPVVQSPGSLIAALAPRKTPLPQFAPRPQALVPLEQPRNTLVAEAVEPSPIRSALDIPVPRPKPEILLASTSAEDMATRRSAADIEAALNGATSTASPQAETVDALIAAAPEGVVPAADGMRIPVPVLAPRPGAQQQVEVAALTGPAPDIAAYAPPAPQERPVEQQPIEVASLREPEASRILASYDTGVATTEKSPRPTLATASTARVNPPTAEIVPVDEIDPARFGSWTTARLSITDYGRAAERPVFIQNALREAPTEVYTDGFRKNAAPDPRRFSGNAVTFLTVSKFAGGAGGDGQPLTLQIPLTN
ncbi:MAG: DUF882 domain-containing protein [Oricola sp.]